MYRTCVSDGRQQDLERLDAALLALRRLTSSPGPRAPLPHEGGQVEVSTMLVVDAVARVGAARCSVGDVAEALTVTHSTASRLVERAARAGMVSRSRDPHEARRALLSLTPAGERLQEAATRFRTHRLATVTADWSAEDVAALARLLERFAVTALPHLVPSTRVGTPDPPERSTP